MSPPAELLTARERGFAGDLRSLAAGLAGREHEVVIYTRREDSARPERERLSSGVVIRQIDAGPVGPVPESQVSPLLGSFGQALAAAWREDLPDVIHAYSWGGGLAAAAARRQLRETALIGGGPSEAPVPLVQTFGAFGAEQRRGAGPVSPGLANRIQLEVALARSSDAIVARSDDEIEELTRMGAPRDRVRMIPAGVDTARFEPSGPVDPRPSVARVLVVGEISPLSGIETMIAALRGLPEVELVVLAGPGDIDEVERLRKGAAHLGVVDRTDFRDATEYDDAVPEARPRLLRSADAAVCVPWRGPGSAAAVLEAMACGVPVVVTAVGPATDVVVDGVTGLHVAPRRPDQLADAVRSLLGDPVRHLGFGVAGADRVRSRYEWTRVAADTERVYAGLLPVPVLVDEEVPDEVDVTTD
ncbi:glycosyltransferase [Cryptosporangium phraense]|uniref:glycosyltransferase n=1 Tax=Cryptosporangium phraense TaxID=2593070 RepID=UPI00147854E8|nr:glycosyltransferase [Cryptosporangium phraense]